MKDLLNNNEFLNLYSSTIEHLDSMNYRNKIYYNILNFWLKNKLNNKSIERYLLQNNIKTIAIYGAGNLGELLYDELKMSDKVLIKYIVDQNNANENIYKIPLVKLSEINKMEKVDVIVITPIYTFDSIKKSLIKLGFNNLICIDDIIIDIYNQ